MEHTEWVPLDKLDVHDIYLVYLKEKLKDLKSYPEHIIVKKSLRDRGKIRKLPLLINIAAG